MVHNILKNIESMLKNNTLSEEQMGLIQKEVESSLREHESHESDYWRILVDYTPQGIVLVF